MKINIISVGKIKEKFYTDAVAEYNKRMSAFAKIKFIELKDERIPNHLSDKFALQIKNIEGDRICSAIDEATYTIVLDKGGKSLDSIAFSKKIQSIIIGGKSHISFVIGGSLGLSQDVLNRADYILSFSEMTFPHQLMKVILMEQIYRAFKISSGGTYHK